MISRKKIYIRNIYYMLAFAYETLQYRDSVSVETEEFEDIYDLYAAILIKGVTNQTKKGIHREYKEIQEELEGLKGKIVMTASIERQTIRNRKMVCEFDEFTENCTANQILKSVMSFLMEREEVKKENKVKLKRLLDYFTEVEKVSWKKIRWEQVYFWRNNTSYRMLLDICKNTIERRIWTEEKAGGRRKEFLEEQSLHHLFEKFVLEYYKKYFARYRPSAKQIKWDIEGETKYLPKMQTDILLRDGERILIIDTKFYSKLFQRRWEKETIHSANLYQIYAYVKNQDKENTKKVAGLLLYAKTIEGENLDIRYRIGGNKIGVMTVDLGVEFSEIKKQLHEIIRLYLEDEN